MASVEELRICFSRAMLQALEQDHCLTHRSSAVLLPLFPGQHGLELILTRRSADLPSHAGQISFPGGSREAGDCSLVHTALRETREEIGLDPAAVEVLGSLEAQHLPSGFCVTPVVGITQTAPRLQPDPAEVAEIFTLPLQRILNMDIYQQGSLMRNGIKREFYFFDYGNYYIWGATANIIRVLALALISSE